MEHIMEQYGSVLLQLAGGAGMLALFGAIFRPGGMLAVILQQYMSGICG